MTLTPPVTSAERLLKLARAARLQRSPAAAPIEPAERGARLPLSFAQQRLWFLEQLGDLGDAYHIPTRLRLGRELDRAALRCALDAIVARHEALRTTFVEVEGEPVQRIAEESRFHLLEHDLGGHPDAAAELRRLGAWDAGAPFDLEHGPLIRGRLVRMPDGEHILLMTMHHIVSDGWSMGVLTRELGTLYEAFRRGDPDPLSPLPVQYADYAIWQRKWVDGEVLRQQAEYWKTTLAGAPELLELPTDRPRPARQEHAGGTMAIDLGEALTAGLKALGQRRGTTLFMTALAGWAAVLARLSGQRDVVVGTPSANRGRAEIDGLIGFFVNTLALRVDLAGSPTVAELLEQVRARSLGAQQHQDIPFEQVVELVHPARSLAYTPLFQVTFAWQNAAEGRPELPGPREGGVGPASQATAKFDLSLALWEAGARIVGSATYATSLFEQATIERYLAYLRRVLEAMAADELQRVDALPLLPEAERRRVVEEWNRTEAPYPGESCVHELFEAQVERAPGAPAVVCGEQALTYAELNARANRLAHHLRTLGVGPDARVAICVERSPEMVVGVLGVLKAGGAWVPLDPAYPVERLRYMLSDSAPTAVLTQTSIVAAQPGLFAGMEAGVLALDAPAWREQPATNPERGALGPAHLAYVIYTSGSTGTPKGVMVAHRNVAALAAAQARTLGVDAASRVLQFASFSFDASVFEMVMALCQGASLHLPPGAAPLAGEALERVVAQGRITHVTLPPAVLPTISRAADLASVRTMVLAGEALGEAAVKQWAGGRRMLNAYGPTEAAVWTTVHACRADEAGDPPIGRPILNARVYVLDGGGEPAPVGVAGELYIGGAGVARGYLGRPALTAERFVPDPFGTEPGARLYRTGDLARWRPDGSLEFVGRADFQVKVRGFRIEPGEIEARLREHEGVREAVVVARENEAGDRRLVAYWAGDATEIDALRAHLSGRLPEHMVPAAYVHLEMLPLTPNGKVDRKALPAPEGDAYARRGYEAPQGETEAALAEIWSALLGVERAGRWDHFFELGGHSLLAVRVISRVRQVLGAEVALADLFEHPVLADLARTIDNAARTELPPIEPADRSAPLPLSFAQQRLWFIDRLEGAGAAHHIPVRQRLRGELDRPALRRGLDRIVARHEALRTVFAEVNGEPVQRIAPAEKSPFQLTEHDLRRAAEPGAELRRLTADEAGAPFDLARGPLIRGRLVRMADDDHVLLITMHHIVSDGWSMEVFTRELGALYAAFREGRPDPLPPLPVQYADYAAWQRRWMEGEVLRRQAEYWKEALAGAPELLELPADRPRPARQDFTGATVGLVLDEALSAALKELSRRHGTTLYMTLLAGWAAMLSRLSGQDDVVIGTPSANRGRQEIEGLIGFFVNMLPVRVALSDAPTVAELLGRVRERALGAQHHQDIPFEQVVELLHPARSMAHAPLFQAMFTWQNAPGTGPGTGGGAGLPGLTQAPIGPAGPSGDSAAGASAEAAPSAQVTANVDLSLVLLEHGGRIAGSVTYAVALFERETVERWAGYLRRVLEGMVADETRRVDRLVIVPEDERRRMVEEWNRTDAAEPGESCVHALFEAQVERAPGAEAVVFEGERLTYAELNAAANRLARRLRAAGVGPEARVGVMLERGPELVVALLAVLKAGGAYLPLDVSLPAARRAALAADAGAAVLVTREPALEGFAGTVVSPAEGEGEDGDDLRLDVPTAALAYVIYTSGSTGTPKGVGVAHAEAAAHCRAAAAAYGLTPADRVLQFAAIGFDVSVEQMLAPLSTGACVVVRGNEVPTPMELARQAAGQGLTVINPPTAYWHQLVADPDALEILARTVRLVIAGGEAMSPAAAREWASGPAAGVRLLNAYGPTETVVTCTAYDVPATLPDGAVHVPVGRPFGGRTAYVLEGWGDPAPLGVPGELCIGGVLARGYLGRPAATAAAFVPDPFSAMPGARMYRTGDRARWKESAGVRECVSAEVSPAIDSRTDALTHSRNGVLEFLGRRDLQVKVRGFRIEPGEIEARLAEHPEVREAVVVARGDAPGETRLVAYVVGGEGASAEALRAYLGAVLPSYMVPSAFVGMDAFPLTPNGKLDRRALPAPDAPAARTYEAPLGETEQALAEIFAEVLGVERVGRGDDFFELGGHSLLAVRVISRVRQVLGAEVALADLFERPVLADLARAIASAARIELPPIEPVERSGALALSFAQQRLWFLDHLSGAGTAYHIPTRLRLQGELDREALARALDRIVARHEALRTTFPAIDGVPAQRIVPVEESRFHLAEHDLSGDPEAQRELRRRLDEEARTPFDLAQGPPIRGLLIRLARDEHVLHVTMHHIVSDGWSMGVFTRELGVLYGAFRRGEPDPLPPLPVQYADYAAWQRRWVEGDVLQAQAEYWTETLGGAPALLELPTDRPRPARQDHAGGAVDVVMDEALTAGLKALSQRHGTTLFMTVLAAWAVVLGRLSGQHDVVVGTPSANRGRTEIEGLIGFFVNTLALRVDLAGSPSVAEVLARVKARSLGAQQHQDIPFEQVVELVQPARSLAHNTLFQVMLTWQNASAGRLELPGLSRGGEGSAPRVAAKAGPLELPGIEPGDEGAAGSAGSALEVAAKVDLALSLWESGGRIVGSATYATALFEQATVQRWLGYLRRALDAMAADDARAVDRLELLDEAERSRVLQGWNRTAAELPRTCVHERFEAQVARTPEAVALVFEDRSLTYAELNARANRLAHHLRGRGVGPDARVAVCIERSPELMVAFLAVLKSGGAYVPLDPGDPEERLRHMLDDGAPALLLAHAGTATRFAGEALPVIDLDADAPGWASESASNPARGEVGLTPGHLAYVIYTSGSTGRPKGVMVEHRALANVMGWMAEAWPLGPDDVVLQKTPVSFDASARELFPPLLAGARMVIARPGGHRDPAYLVETIRREGVTTLHFVPTMLQFLLEEPGIERCTSIARVVCGGEALPAALARRAAELLPHAELHNVYGPTEAAVDVTWLRAPAEVAGAHLSIGRPMANCRAYFLDEAGGPAPLGVAGELYLGGAQVARGYLGRAALTAERFVPDPFGGEPGARLYRTGDLGRWREESASVRERVSAEVDPEVTNSRIDALTHARTAVIEFLGRNDFQVKVRGFRIELGEIEARLREHGGVREAVVVARENDAGDRRLVAYWVGGAVEIDALRTHLSGRLPEHMVPPAYVRLDALPLTSNGKLDRKALPAPEGDAYARRGYEAPQGEMEQALAEIWGEVLGVERVGRHDNFFELGGHSLLAVRVVSRTRQVLGAEVGIADLFERPVLADLARAIEDAARTELPPIERVDRSARMPLSFAQQRLWFLERLGGLGTAYHVPTRVRLQGELDRGALVRTLDRLVERHEVLRTTFVEAEGEPVQRIAPPGGFHLLEHDLGGHADAEAELRRLAAEEWAAPFDLEHGPLIRGRLIRLAEDDHVLLVTMHHIVSDGWSRGVLTRELGALYAAFRRGDPDPLPPLPVQYADYAAWQRTWVEGEVLREQTEYWKTTLTGAPELLELPVDHARPARQDFSGGLIGIGLDEELTAGLKALGQRHGTTLFMTLLAGWAALLARLSGQDDVVVGTPSANRGRTEIEGLIGFFINTLALRVDFSGSPTVAELLGQVRARSLGAQQHQDIPFEQVVELMQPARSLAHTPLFQVMFIWQNAPEGELELSGLAAPEPGPRPVSAAQEGPAAQVGAAARTTAKFDLSLALAERDGRIVGAVEYAASLFERGTIERWAGYLRRVLAEMVVDDSRPVERLAFMPESERALVLEAWNRTGADYPGGVPVHALFQAQAARTPSAAAVVHGEQALSYAELNARANRLARRLAERGVRSGDRVAIAMPRSIELVVAELAVLKAGAAYVPVDPSVPAERMAFMVADSGAAILLALPGADLAILSEIQRIDVHALDDGDAADPSTGVDGDAPAYVVYTSGSTGAPKGVVVPHRAITRLVINNGYADFGPGDRVAFAANPAFDASTLEVWAPLLNGGRIVIIPQDVLLEPRRFADALARHQVDVLWMSVGLFNQYADELKAGIPRLRYLIVGGDALDPHVIARVLREGPPRHLLNGYGPTETTTFAITHEITGVAEGRGIPLGRPIANTRVYVLDAHGEPVPVGVAGEMYVGGAGVALGYLHRPQLTAERFVIDPFTGQPGARMYRTGDVGRWRADGTIEFVGRTDFQVKVRGFRIELGEIEARLLAHPEVREAVVLAREDAPGDKRLVAYVVAGERADAEALRAHVAGRLPEYMVPAAYVRLEQLPLTPNGKVDRRALPAPEGDALATRGYEAPVGETEQALAEVWAEVLRVERVGRRDNFFELGGHSLLAVRVISRVRQALGAEVALGDLFERPVLADFARGIDDAARTGLPPIERVDRGARLPLSFAQQRLWFLEQLDELGGTYHIATRLRLRLGGEVDRAALRRALDAIVARHEALRTTFVEVEGEPVQRIAEASRFHLREHDLAGHPDAAAELGRLAAEEAGTPFNLEHGPLIRGRLVRTVDDEHVLLMTMHHIVSDGWSMGVLTRELGTLYDAFRRGAPDPLPPLPVQYADYAIWQRTWVEGEVLRRQAEYWKTTLSGAPELLELPTDRPRPARQDHAGGIMGIDLGEELTAGLKALGQRRGTTPFMTLLAGWAAVLARLSGQDDVVVGTPSANRGRTEIEGLIGFFVNTLALRVDLSGSPTVAELLEQVRARSLGAQQNQDIPFEQVVDLVQPARSLAHTPLFQVMFAWQSASEGRQPELPGLRAGGGGSAGAASQAAAKFDLSLSLGEAGGRIAGTVTYAAALFERETVERWVGYLRRVLEAFAADDLQAVDALTLLPEAERRRVVEEWSATGAAPPSERCIHALFEARARGTPEAVALVHADEALTYAELDARANRLAHHLRRLGVGPEARVGVLLAWSPELVVALLAVLKAGGVYVPLDPSLPDERLAYMAEDAGAGVVVTRAALAGRLGAGVTVRVDADAERIAAERGEAPASGVAPESLAYLIYTSGSTGRPKGVAVEHRAAAAHFPAMAGTLGIVREDRVLQFASSGFDVSLEQVFVPLLTGATLVLRGAELWSPAEFAERARSLGVTVANLPPAYWQEVLATGALPRVRLLLVGGDALSAAAAAAGDATRLLNCYGPTEAVVTATAFAVPDGFAEGFARSTAPIGRPLPGRSAYVLDARGAPVPPGVAGELFLGGLLARGYLGRPALTAERFVPDPLGGGAGARLYRTGDRARWLLDGTIEFLGRTDFQVKVRGFRIEPGEIEARLREHASVREAVVAARDVGPGDTRLVAYVVAPGPVESEALRGYLAERLPEYMVPSAFVRMDAFPLTPSGKVDRKALPAPEGDAFATRGYEAPVGDTEQALAEVWSELLGVEQVGRRDNFFELGGHSLLAVRVISRMRQVLGAELGIADLFERPVLADLARAIENAARTDLPPIERVDRGGRLPLSFAQQRLWFLEQLGDLGDTYHIPTRLRLQGELDRAALRRALDAIVARHEALRTTFVEVEGEPVQRIAEESRFHLLEHDLGGHPDAAAELRRLAAEEAGAPFDLEHGPLIRGRLVRLADDEHVLLMTMHHIVADGWSMEVLTRELRALDDAFRRGDPDPLPPLPVQYADYAAWQRKWVAGEVLREQAEYWKTTLAGVPELLELPTDRPRPARKDHAGAALAIDLGEELTAGLKALGQRRGTTLFMTLLAGWAAVLGRLSGQHDVVVGAPSANRGRAEIEGLIGFFVNTLALRVDFSGSPTVAELLEQVRARSLGAQQNQDIPFEQVVDLVQPARSLAHTPLFQVMFAWQSASEGRPELPGLTVGGVGPASQATAKFDLALALGEAGGRVVGSLTYATSLFEQATVERYLAYLRRVLEAMVADDLQAVDALPLLPETERRLVVEEWNATDAEYPRGLCMHQLFEAQVRRTPDAAALISGDLSLTYAELNARANRLARMLAALGAGPERIVALTLERSVEMVVALLAVTKAGAAFLPVDPAYPAERRRWMLDRSAAPLILTTSALAADLPETRATVVALDRVAAEIEAEDDGDLSVDVHAENAAYVIFTSGSTGRPKGVVVPHRGIGNLAAAQREAFGVEPDGRVLQSASFSFDAAVAEVAHTLLSGAALVMARPGQAGPELLALMRDRAVTVATLPPALLAVLPADDLPALRTVVSAGEAVSADVVARWGAGRRFVNAYGPTETTVCATVSIDPSTSGRPAIGGPIANVRAYVLDARMHPVPVGVPGELYVGGVGVARGYLGQPVQTAERFVPDAFGGDAGARLYRTGDRARWLSDGTIEFLGRADFQVKVRGFRIEPGEIEARLRQHGAVREAVVVAREDVSGDRRLVAYYVGEAVAIDALRAHLSERLPEYMLPAAYVHLDALPLTPNGKLDRGALPAPEGDAFATRRYEAPVGEVEQALAGIWAELLGVERVGRRDNFFELGGHSLLAVRVISRVRQVLDAEVVLAHVFSHPTVQSLAARLTGADDGQRSDRAIAIRPSGSQPPLFLAYEGVGSIAYAQVLHPHIDADIPVYALPSPSPSEPPLRTVEGMAARLVRMIREVQPSGPYRLAGWSFGGVLAYEVAAQLIGRDDVVEFVGMLDSYHPARAGAVPHDVAQEHALLLHVLRMAEPVESSGRVDLDEAGVATGDVDLETFVTRCREQGLLPGHVTVEQARRMRDGLRDHQHAVREYSPQPLPVAVHLFPAQQSADPEPSRGWRATLPATQLRVTPVPGTHLSMMRPPNVATLGEALSRALDRAREEAPPFSGAGGSPVVMLQGGAAGAAPLFCVPGAGSGVTSFVDLMLALDPSVPVYGLQPRGLDGEAPPHATVQAAAVHYLRALAEAGPAGPIHLLGHSFGGWVALEMALRLHEAGRPVASLTILDSEVPNDSEAVVREYGGGEAFLKLVEVLEMAAERSLGIGPADVASRDEAGWLKLLHGKMLALDLLGARTTPEVLSGPFRAFARCLRTAYRPRGIYPGRLRLVLVDDPAKDEAANRATFAEAERGWRAWAPGLVFSVGAGNHVTALKPPHVAVLAGLLAEDRGAREG